ncbi:unnamed protein product, partial [Gadus morhua 'NCC']
QDNLLQKQVQSETQGHDKTQNELPEKNTTSFVRVTNIPLRDEAPCRASRAGQSEPRGGGPAAERRQRTSVAGARGRRTTGDKQLADDNLG